MEIMELMKKRHSIRQYKNQKIEQAKREILNNLVIECNGESGLNIQIIYDEPKCFNAIFSKIARFKNCNNYIVMIGKKEDKELEFKTGYYGEKIVLKTEEIGLNTCWVGLTHGKTPAIVNDDERVVIVIALGYGSESGKEHKSKTISEVSNVNKNLPEWYKKGIEGALLAPTAVNQQKFSFVLEDDKVTLIPGKGAYSLVDAGIVRYHFEKTSGHNVELKI